MGRSPHLWHRTPPEQSELTGLAGRKKRRKRTIRARRTSGHVATERLLLDTATRDGRRVRVGFGKDPGQAGKSQAFHLVRALSGFDVTSAGESGNKVTRFGPFSAQCRAGNVKILRGA